MYVANITIGRVKTGHYKGDKVDNYFTPLGTALGLMWLSPIPIIYLSSAVLFKYIIPNFVKTITKEPFRKWFEGEEAIKQKLK
jgi:hypothetical protein